MARRDRIERLQVAMQDTALDALWIHPAEDFRYLTGLAPIAMERLFGLVIPASGPTRLVVPLLLAEECSEIEECELFTWTDEAGPQDAAAAALGGLATLGMLPGSPLWSYEAVRSAAPLLDVSVQPSLTASLRKVKDTDELALMKAASKEADGIADWIEALEPAGMTEAQVSSQIVRRILEIGMTPHTGAIVSSGANAAMPHYAGGDVTIASDQPLLVDFGGAVEGYWSDITRMYLPPETDDEVLKAYDVVVEASLSAFEKAGPGVTCGEVDAAARCVIEGAGLGDHFIHRTGHGLGLEEHEAPFIKADNRTELEPGNVFTIEPGVYLSGRFGLRYENVVMVTEEGVESFNESPVHHGLG